MAVAITVSSTFQHKNHFYCNIYEQSNRNEKKRKKIASVVKLMLQTNCQTDARITNSERFRRKITSKKIIKTSSLKEAADFLYLTEQPRLWINTNVYAFLLQTCIDLKALTEGLRIHVHMIKTSFKPNMYLNNILVSMYVKFGKLRYARRVFDKMPKRNKVSWTTLISGYAQNGLADEAVKLFCEMHCGGVKASVVTFVCVVQAMAEIEVVELGRQVHGYIVKSECEVNLYLESALVDLYGSCGNLGDAFKLFDKMSERDVVAWTVMIAGCAKQGCGEETLRLFYEMQCDGEEPNEFTVASVLKACAQLSALREGKQVHAAIIRTRIRQDVYVDGALIDMYVKCGCVWDARKVFDRMLKHNTVSWTAMIAGYAQNGFGKEAIELFRAMLIAGMKPNQFTLVSILKACVVLKAENQGKQVHAQIIKSEYELNPRLLSTLIDLYAKCGNSVYAGKVFLQLPIQDAVSWTTMIAGHVQQGHGEEALALLARMLGEGMKPNQFTFTSILRACSALEALDQGKQLHGSISKAQFESDLFVGSALIDMYAKCGNLVHAHRVFDRMPERNEVSWYVIIKGYVRHGYSREALRLIYQMLKSGMKPEDHIIASVLNSYAGNSVL